MTLKGHDRKHFVVVPLDGPFRVKHMAPSIQALKKAAAASNGAVGVGLLSMMGFEHTRNELSVSLLLLPIFCRPKASCSCACILATHSAARTFVCTHVYASHVTSSNGRGRSETGILYVAWLVMAYFHLSAYICEQCSCCLMLQWPN